VVDDGAAGDWSSLELERLCNAGRFTLPGHHARTDPLSLPLS